MDSDLERLLSKAVSVERKPEPAIHWHPQLGKSTDRYMTLMRFAKTHEERQEFHDLMDLEMNKPIHPERSECNDPLKNLDQLRPDPL